jgi:tetratricopeptide (TPR) repeat protein
MRGGLHVAAAAAAMVCLGLEVSTAGAAVTVMGGGLAESCSKAALLASRSAIADDDAIRVCTLAIGSEPLSDRDLAGTHVNRGILYLARSAFRDAKHDFDTALYIEPTMGEAYVNRGAALIGERHFGEGLADIDKGLTLNPEQPEKAYFDRGLAHEYMNDLKSAYLDYLKASELKPDWDVPKKELARFSVTRAGTH